MFYNAAGNAAFAAELEAESKKPNAVVRCMPGRQFSISFPVPGPPLHDENSHGADAFRYLAVCVDQMGNDVSVADPYSAFRRRA